MKPVKFLFLSQADILKINLGIDEVASLVEKSLVEHGWGRVENPPKPGIHSKRDAFIHAMPSYLKEYHLGGIKWVGGYPSNRNADLPTIMGVLILNDMETGAPLCVMDCGWITAVRTAAVTAVTAKYCKRKDTKEIGIIGAGVQGRNNLVALKSMIPNIIKAKVYDINSSASESLKRDFEKSLNIEILICDNPEKACKNSNIIVTGTQKLEKPIVKNEWFEKGCLGFGLENSRAWYGDAILGADKFITDDWDQTVSFSKIGAFPDGLPALYAELGKIVTGQLPGRTSEEERILAINIGLALEDMVVADRLYKMALELKMGQTLQLL